MNIHEKSAIVKEIMVYIQILSYTSLLEALPEKCQSLTEKGRPIRTHIVEHAAFKGKVTH